VKESDLLKKRLFSKYVEWEQNIRKKEQGKRLPVCSLCENAFFDGMFELCGKTLIDVIHLYLW
jgi:hypothetical protein